MEEQRVATNWGGKTIWETKKGYYLENVKKV